MNHDDVAELLGAYALDAVDPDEAALVEEHLAVCGRCRAEVEQHRETAALLAHTGGDAPTGPWERIEGVLDGKPPELGLVGLRAYERQRPRRTRRVPVVAALAAAAAVVVVAFLGVELRQQERRIDELQAALRDPLAPALQDALEDPGSRIVELVGADGELVVRGAVTEDGVGYLQAGALPVLDPGRTYQLWGAAGDELVSLGVLGPDPGVVRFRAEPYGALAITAERAPGVVASTNPPVVAGAL